MIQHKAAPRPKLVPVIVQYRWREPAGLHDTVISHSSCLVKVESSKDISAAFRRKMLEIDRDDAVMTAYTPENGRSTF